MHHRRSRDPPPPAAHMRPAAIVERCKSPRLRPYPRASPWSDRDPTTRTVWSPIRRYRARVPNRTVIFGVVPIPIVGKVCRADRVRVDIASLGREGPPILRVALPRKPIQFIPTSAPDEVCRRRVRPTDPQALPASEHLLNPVPIHANLPRKHADHGDVILRKHVHTRIAGLQQRHRNVWRIKFRTVSGIRCKSSKMNAALSQAKLRVVVCQ